MSAQIPEKPRGGKYCPRCRAMNPRDQVQCGQCGHRFRTGTELQTGAGLQSGADTTIEATAEPDLVNRTQQFVLPPLPARVPAPPAQAAAAVPSVQGPSGLIASPAALLSPRLLILTLTALALCLAVFVYWQLSHAQAPAAAATPVGIWETTLTSRTSADAHLEFAFQPGGVGRFSWRETGPAASSGQTPLAWRENPDQTLTLTLTAPKGGDPVSQTLAGIFSSHPWTWHEDPAAHRLTLGTLVFTEKS